MKIRALLSSCVLAAAGVLTTLAPSAQAQAWDPIAFGPLGSGLPGGQYFSTVVDIAGDGRTFVGGTNLGQAILRTPAQDFTLTGNFSPFAISRNGQTVSGGTSNQAPRRWDLSNAVGNNIASTAIAFPPGAFANNPAYGVNHNGTHFSFATQTSVVTPTAFHNANTAFQGMALGAFAGAYRGLASNAPILMLLGNIPGNPTNAYRWNYETNVATPMNMPAGAANIDAGGVGASLSSNGLRSGGTATIGGTTRPYWWDENGTPHAVTPLAGSVFGNMSAMNYTGNLGGGNMFLSGQGNRAFLYELDTGVVYNLDQIYRAAGLLPTGWTLIATRHISDDGTRIFCTATAPDGSTRAVLLEGSYVPTPGTLALAGLAGLVATRRRR